MTTYGVESLIFRAKLASLWTSLMFVYVYADILSFYRPGVVNKMIDGMMGPIKVSQVSLMMAAILMLIPCLMVAAAFLFTMPVTRKLHAVMGGLFMLVSIGNLVGESWWYYLAYGVVEIALTVTIVIYALRSPANKLSIDSAKE